VSSTRLRRTAAAVALAALALTGCSNQAGAASVVGDQVVTDADIASIVEQAQEQLATVKGTTFDEKSATSAALTTQTQHLIFEAVARQEGITVTPGQVDAYIKNIVDTQFSGKTQALYDALVSQNNIPAGQLSAIVRDQLIYDALMAKIASGVTDATAKSTAFTKYMTAFVDQIGVEVAPRYGTWNVFALGPVPDDLSFVPTAPPSVGRPIPLPNPAN
jgi:hypothetical protein